ncbi:hypothetical protein DSUL_20332 [Desulfovibrionales bacterium]
MQAAAVVGLLTAPSANSSIYEAEILLLDVSDGNITCLTKLTRGLSSP